MRSWLVVACLLLAAPLRAGDDDKRKSEQHYLSGMIYYQAQDYEKARAEWRLAQQLDPTNPDAPAGLSRIDRLLGPAPPAAEPKLPAKRSKREPSPDAMRRSEQHYLSGLIYYQKDDFGKAREEWRQALKLVPNNEEALAALQHLDRPEVFAGAPPGTGPIAAPAPSPGPAPQWKDVPLPDRSGPLKPQDFPDGRSGKRLDTLDAAASK